MDKCSDCGGQLENGAILDHTYGAIIAGRYAKVDLREEKNKLMMMTEADFQETRRIIAKRCTKCNRIFLYGQNTVVNKAFSQDAHRRTILILGITFVIIIAVIAVSSILALS